MVVVHHIATDGWSTGLLARDISVAYAARRAGREPGWAPLPVQYADYAIWQRELLGEDDPGSVLSGQVRGTGAGSWPGAPGSWCCPRTGRARRWPPTAGTRCRSTVSAGVHARLAVLAREHGVTMFMVVQAAVAVLLSRLGAGADLPVGTPVAGRTDAALDELVGFFVNTLVLRTDVSGDPSFAGLLGRVRDGVLGALDHQDVPFERLVEVLAPDRSLARHPLFQVMVAVQNNAPAVLDLPGLHVSGLPAGRPAARFDLEFDVAEARAPGGGPGGLAGTLVAAADLFDAATVPSASPQSGWCGCWPRSPPTRPCALRQVDVLDAAERDLVVAGWNDTAVPVPAGTLAGLLAGRVAVCPDAVAVACGDVALSATRSWTRGRGGWRGWLAAGRGGAGAGGGGGGGAVGGAGGGAGGGAAVGGGVPAGGSCFPGRAGGVHAG